MGFLVSPLTRWLIDSGLAWLLGNYWRALVFGAVMVIGAAAVMFWLGRITLRPPAGVEELPEVLDEVLAAPVPPDDYRGRRRRGRREHRYLLHERDDDQESNPSPRTTLYGRPLSPIARALRHPAVQLPVVPADETTAFLVRAVDGTLVYQRKRDVRTGEVLADGEVHRG